MIVLLFGQIFNVVPTQMRNQKRHQINIDEILWMAKKKRWRLSHVIGQKWLENWNKTNKMSRIKRQKTEEKNIKRIKQSTEYIGLLKQQFLR